MATENQIRAASLQHCVHDPPHLKSQYRQCLGARGESAIAEYCAAKNWQILDRNWRIRAGELDLVVKDGACVAAVEVKTRCGQALGSPFLAITPPKLARIRKLLAQWARQHDLAAAFLRVDAAAVVADKTGKIIKIDYIKGVYSD